MRKVLVLALALGLSGCATLPDIFGPRIAADIRNVAGIVSGITVTPQAVVIAANSVDALQDTATAYLRLPLCRTGGSPACRVKAATQPIKRAVLTMRTARNEIERFLAAHPGSAPPATMYEKLTAAISALNSVIAQYHDHAAAVVGR